MEQCWGWIQAFGHQKYSTNAVRFLGLTVKQTSGTWRSPWNMSVTQFGLFRHLQALASMPVILATLKHTNSFSVSYCPRVETRGSWAVRESQVGRWVKGRRQEKIRKPRRDSELLWPNVLTVNLPLRDSTGHTWHYICETHPVLTSWPFSSISTFLRFYFYSKQLSPTSWLQTQLFHTTQAR